MSYSVNKYEGENIDSVLQEDKIRKNEQNKQNPFFAYIQNIDGKFKNILTGNDFQTPDDCLREIQRCVESGLDNYPKVFDLDEEQPDNPRTR